jgi:DNA mismatch endonuclease (patch repair protein)
LLRNKVTMSRSEMMSRIGSRNTAPEIMVRQGLHRLGFRFRLHRNDLPGKPDIVLPKHSAVILVHGCFWHGHEGCKNFRIPKTNSEFWIEKIGRNISRDAGVVVALKALGWRVLTVWECATASLSGESKLCEIAQWLESRCVDGEVLG